MQAGRGVIQRSAALASSSGRGSPQESGCTTNRRSRSAEWAQSIGHVGTSPGRMARTTNGPRARPVSSRSVKPPLMSRWTRPRFATVPSVTTGSLTANGLRGRRKAPRLQVTGGLDDASWIGRPLPPRRGCRPALHGFVRSLLPRPLPAGTQALPPDWSTWHGIHPRRALCLQSDIRPCRCPRRTPAPSSR